MPTLIETRPFTIVPELYAWPSFRIFSERVFPLYLLFAVVIALLLWSGLQIGVGLAVGFALVALLIGLGLSYLKYFKFLKKPENQALFRECRVELREDELRQDFSDGSHMAMKFFAITSFREVGDFYFAFATKQHAIVVPKTAFSSADEAQIFAATIKGVAAKK